MCAPNHNLILGRKVGTLGGVASNATPPPSSVSFV
jgi:hypothetical protein